MAEIKLQRTAYKYSSTSALYFKVFPVVILGILASMIRPEFFVRLKISWTQSLTLTEVEPGKYELSSFKDVDLAGFFRNLRLSSSDLFLLVLSLFTLLYLLVLLSCVWFTSLRLLLFYRRCGFKEGTAKFGEFITNYATHLFVNELVLNTNSLDSFSRRNRVLLPLYRTGFIFYIHDYKKFVYNSSNNRFDPVEHIDDIDVAKVRNWQGLLSVSDGVEKSSGLEPNLNVCADLYGPNDYPIPECNFWKMLLQAFLAPFFLFQLTSTLLWIFDDYLYYSLVSIFSMILIEVQMVYKRVVEYNRINSMKLPPYHIYAYRDHKWQLVLTSQLYPGDIVLMTTVPTTKSPGSVKSKTTTGNDILICPCDCLILDGEIIVDESILTGESIPQFKTSVEDKSVNQRNSTIFSGTTIILTKSSTVGGNTTTNQLLYNLKGINNYKGVEKLINNACVCIVIRTGFESYQGRLVHSIINSDPNTVVNNNREGYLFLFFLMLFAVAAVTFVVKKSNYKSLKKLLLVSSRIFVSVIPPEFPVTLSMAVTIGLIQLRKRGIYCTEPNRLPLAANIDVIAFDKTGTLTQDQMYLNGLYLNDTEHNYINPLSKSDDSLVNKMLYYSKLVIGGCHSLTYLNNLITGDPMEKISFTQFNNTIDKHNNNIIHLDTGTKSELTLKILKRWRFTSELGRMTVISEIKLNNEFADYMKNETLLLTKGSPEKVKTLLRVVPVHFDSLCHELTIKGLRVLCLGYKKLYDIPVNALINIDRNIVEKDLEFCGFLALEAPIKNSSRVCMKRLKGFKKIMITGDNILTACYVTQQINMINNVDSGYDPLSRDLINNKYGNLTIKEYLKSYKYNLVDECPISNLKLDSIKKCPVYKENNCPFLLKPHNKVNNYIIRCPLTQSINNSKSTSNTGSPVLDSELFSRNSYKRFLESCPLNKQFDSVNKCPYSPNFTTPHQNLVGKRKKSKCPITYMKNLFNSMYLLSLKVLFPYHYYMYYSTDPSCDVDSVDDVDRFAILSHYKGNFMWKKRNGEDYFPNSTNKQIILNMYRLLPNHILCLTGNVLQLLMTNSESFPTEASQQGGTVCNISDIILLVNSCNIFARMSPQQKEFIIKCFKLNNKIVAMCGDGTNDVSALKQSHIGISLLNIINKDKYEDSGLNSPKYVVFDKLCFRKKLRETLTDDLPSIKLGEASVASPFTYHGTDVNCVFNLIKSGRCSLYNLFMLYKLMGINSVITALGI